MLFSIFAFSLSNSLESTKISWNPNSTTNITIKYDGTAISENNIFFVFFSFIYLTAINIDIIRTIDNILYPHN